MFKTIFFLIMIFVCAYSNDAYKISLSEKERLYLQQKDVYKVCVDPQSYPFEEITSNGVYKGITADLIQKVALRLGIFIQVQHALTWDDSLKLAKLGQCDIISFIEPSDESQKWLLFSESLFSEPNVFITREEHPYIEDMTKVSHESIVIPIVSDLFTRFSKEYKNLIVIPVSTKEEALRMVSTQKADMTIRSMIDAAYSIKNEGLFNLKVAGVSEGYENTIRLSVMQENSLLLNLLNKAILTLTQEEKDQSVNKHSAIKIENRINKESIKYLSYGLLFLVLIIVTVIFWNTLLRKKVAKEVAKNSAIQHELFQASKEAEIGKIIANISHQWRGTLAKIGALNLFTLVQLKKDQPLNKEFLTQQNEEIGNLLDFMSQTMQDFLEFYKPTQTVEAFGIIQTIQQAINILETKINNSSLRITYQGDTDMQLTGIKNQWVHIWLNLIDNTINAATIRHNPTPFFDITINENEIIINDNAGGMAPMNTTMGLGVKMCIELANKHHADFLYHNTDEGLCICIRFKHVSV